MSTRVAMLAPTALGRRAAPALVFVLACMQLGAMGTEHRGSYRVMEVSERGRVHRQACMHACARETSLPAGPRAEHL